MDLRGYNLSLKQIELASCVLDYQPFIISDDVQTGVAYSWLHSDDPRVSPPLVFRRPEWLSHWDKITAANDRLRRMYDDFVDEIVDRYRGGSLFDVACNNGYFPIRAASRGMRDCVGSDLGAHHSKSITFLNQVLGTSARFVHAPYDLVSGKVPISDRFDVVVASAIMCHVPNPLHFLAALGAVAREAIFFWGQMLETEELVTAYQPPHPNLSDQQRFPYCFNDNTRVSKGLFREAARQMGFREVIFLEPRSHWFFAESPSTGDMIREIREGSAHVAVLAAR